MGEREGWGRGMEGGMGERGRDGGMEGEEWREGGRGGGREGWGRGGGMEGWRERNGGKEGEGEGGRDGGEGEGWREIEGTNWIAGDWYHARLYIMPRWLTVPCWLKELNLTFRLC